jgi:hypothetical protein
MNKLRVSLLVLLLFGMICAHAQGKWHYDFGLGASLNAGNVNNCNVSNDGALERNDSLLAFDVRYKLIYSAFVDRNSVDQHWKETNFEINGGAKIDVFQYDVWSPFLACEMLTNKYKGYDFKVSGLVGLKYRIYTIPKICDYSISAAFVYDWTDFTDETHLPNNNYRISIRPKIKQKLFENLTLTHTTFFQPSVLDFGDFIITSSTKLETKISQKLFLDISFTYGYRSRIPAANYKRNDIMTEVTIRYKNEKLKKNNKK